MLVAKKYFLLIACLICVATSVPYVAQGASITVSPPKFEYSVNPGEVVGGSISITNGDSVELVLSTSVANFSADGESGKALFTDSHDSSAFSLASWVTFPDELVRVGANQKAVVPFTITVPNYAEAGGHFGTIFFSPITAGDGAISIKQKVGVLMLVRVSGDIQEASVMTNADTYSATVTEDTLATVKPKHVFSSFPITIGTRIENTGNVHTKPAGTVTLYNMFGTQLTAIGEEVIINENGAVVGTKIVDYLPLNDKGGNVLPQSSRVFLAPWKGFAQNRLTQEGDKFVAWKGVGFGRYRADIEMQLNSGIYTKTIHFWIIPWLIIIPPIIGIIVLVVLIRFMRTRSRNKLRKQMRKELEQEQQNSTNE